MALEDTAAARGRRAGRRERPQSGPVSPERLTFFVDAVLAIAITLLALDLPLPTGGTNRDLLHSLAGHRDDYLAFAISYVVIWGHWSSHHRLFRHVENLGGALTQLTMVWLMMMVLTPFATRTLTGDGAYGIRFTLYATVQFVAGVMYMLIIREIARHHLLRPGADLAALRLGYIRTGVIITAYLVSIPVAFVTKYAYGVWIAIPFLLRLTHLLTTRLGHVRAESTSDRPGR